MTTTVDTFEGVWVVCGMLSICALGVVLNAIVILVVILTPAMRHSTDLFIVNLSVSSILLGGLSLPLKIASVFYNQIDLYASDLACKITQFVPLLTIMSAISTMTAISFERYFAIARQKNFTLRTTLVVILSIWVVSLATSAPQLYEYSARLVPDEDGNGTHLSCGSHDMPESFETIYASVILAVSYVIPLVLISTNYFRLVAFLHRLSKRNKGANPGQGGYTVCRSKVIVLRMTILLTSVFAVLWLSYFVLFTVEEITDTDNSRHASSGAHTAKHVMMALSTVSNPALYAAFTKTFQRRLTGCCRHCKRVATEETFLPNGDDSKPSGSLNGYDSTVNIFSDHDTNGVGDGAQGWVNKGKSVPQEMVKERERVLRERVDERETSPQEGNDARENCHQNKENKWENGHLEDGSERKGGPQEVENKMESGHQDGESETESGQREGKSRWGSNHQEGESESESGNQEGKTESKSGHQKWESKNEYCNREGESRRESGCREMKSDTESGLHEGESKSESGHHEVKGEKENNHQEGKAEKENGNQEGKTVKESGHQEGKAEKESYHQDRQSQRETSREQGESDRENCRQKREIRGQSSRLKWQSQGESDHEENCKTEWNSTERAKQTGKYCEETDGRNEQYIHGIWCPGWENHVFDPEDEDVQNTVYKLHSRQAQACPMAKEPRKL